MNRTLRPLFLAAILSVSITFMFWHGRSALAAPAADPAALVKVDQDFDAATAKLGQAGFASFISDDMTTIRENTDIVRGKPGFLEGWKKILTTPGVHLRWQPQLARISDDGTLGFTVGTYQTTSQENGTPRQEGSGKYVTIWRKQPDGSWKVIFDSGVHDDVPAAKQGTVN